MRKLFLLVIGLVIAAVVMCAQTPQPKKIEPQKTTKAQSHAEKCNLKNCCMMKGGKMVIMKDGKEMPMESDVTTSNGTKIMKDGSIITKDGKKSMMKNDDCIDMTGVWGKMPAEKKSEKK